MVVSFVGRQVLVVLMEGAVVDLSGVNDQWSLHFSLHLHSLRRQKSEFWNGWGTLVVLFIVGFIVGMVSSLTLCKTSSIHILLVSSDGGGSGSGKGPGSGIPAICICHS